MKLTPTSDRVLVELERERETTASGLGIPESARERPRWGVAVAVGPGSHGARGRFIPTTIATGDRVCVPWATGLELVIGGRLHIMCRESELLAMERTPSVSS